MIKYGNDIERIPLCMNYAKLMADSLESLLKEGEQLKTSIYGILRQDHADFYGFFGLTDKALIIALIKGKTVTYTTRLSLSHLKSASVEKIALNQYKISLNFGDGAPCDIIASKKVLMIANQKYEFPLFVEAVTKLAPKPNVVSLKEMKGDKIRTQYFNMVLYFYLMIMAPIMAFLPLMMSSAGRSFTLSEFIEGSWIIFVFLFPFILLSILNRFLFGKLVCVLTHQGIHTESAFLEWNKIVKITYCPQIPSKYGMRVPKDFCHAAITVRNENGGTYEIVVPHCPLYAIRKMKKLSEGHNITFKYKFTAIIIVIAAIFAIYAVIFAL